MLETGESKSLSLTRRKRRGHRYYLTRYEANGDIYRLKWSARRSVAAAATLITPDGEEWVYVITEKGLNLLAYHLGSSPQEVVFEVLEAFMEDAIAKVRLYQEACGNEEPKGKRRRKRLQ